MSWLNNLFTETLCVEILEIENFLMACDMIHSSSEKEAW